MKRASKPAAWTLDDLRALCRGAGMREDGTMFRTSTHRVVIHDANRVVCAYSGPATADYFVGCPHTIEGAIAWLLRWMQIGFIGYVE